MDLIASGPELGKLEVLSFVAMIGCFHKAQSAGIGWTGIRSAMAALDIPEAGKPCRCFRMNKDSCMVELAGKCRRACHVLLFPES